MDRRTFLLAACGAAWVAPSARAQFATPIRAGLLNYVEGEVWVDDRRLDTQTVRMETLQQNERLQTGRGGAEIVLRVGRILRLGRRSEVVLRQTDLDAVEVEVVSGRAYLVWSSFSGSDATVDVRVGEARWRVSKPGRYRLDVRPDHPTRWRVFSGKASLTLQGREIVVKSKRQVELAGEATAAERFDPRNLDRFDAWNANRSRKVGRLSRAGNRHLRERRIGGLRGSPLPDASESGPPRAGSR